MVEKTELQGQGSKAGDWAENYPGSFYFEGQGNKMQVLYWLLAVSVVNPTILS